jgi:hypothetical protein
MAVPPVRTGRNVVALRSVARRGWLDCRSRRTVQAADQRQRIDAEQQADDVRMTPRLNDAATRTGLRPAIVLAIIARTEIFETHRELLRGDPWRAGASGAECAVETAGSRPYDSLVGMIVVGILRRYGRFGFGRRNDRCACRSGCDTGRASRSRCRCRAGTQRLGVAARRGEWDHGAASFSSAPRSSRRLELNGSGSRGRRGIRS